MTGELEVLLGSAADSERLVSALALPLLTVPLAWSRRAPLPALVVVALALAVQAALGGLLAGSAVTTIAVLALALFAAGRSASDGRAFAAAAGAASVLAATRIAFDPAAQSPREALLTCVAVATPLLIGRWARGQSLLQRELADRAARRARDRARDARHAAEEERARIAADLQVAVAEGLRDDRRPRRAAARASCGPATIAPRASGWPRSPAPPAPRSATCGACSACSATTARRRGSRRRGRTSSPAPPRRAGAAERGAPPARRTRRGPARRAPRCGR